ncbi:nucleotidyltransferase family protein [Paenibacillaceae bacterium]|nr:nucleotidyltransferase family protein [Paenibacillaceae bacterium]
MNIRNEQDIIQLVKDDSWMMEILAAAKSLHLPDWWVCAGFVRSKIWDTLHGFAARTPLSDVDVIYFDPVNLEEAAEKELEGQLMRINAAIPWSVKNEARMHLSNGIPPYLSSVDAISRFPETATALGVTLDEQNEVVLTAPWGIEDVLNCVVRPTPSFAETAESFKIYEDRVAKKNWPRVWSDVKVIRNFSNHSLL